MSDKIKLTLARIGNGLFVPALGKLCGLNVHSGRDTYALMRTVDQINPALEAFRATKESLLKKHGAKSVRTAAGEQLVLLPDDPGCAPFLAELAAVAETEVELFLDHKLPLPLHQLDGVFTPFELKELADTILEIKV